MSSFSIPSSILPFVIGIWRFREAKKQRQWYATYCYRGHYYDAVGGDTPQSAVDAIVAGVKKLQRKKKGK